MREKYEDILKGNEELPLPIHYKHLLALFSNLDTNINLLKHRKQMPTFTVLKSAIESSLHRAFTVEHFQQILFVAPKLFVHRWEYRNKNYDLVIDIPKNLKEILADNSVEPSS